VVAAQAALIAQVISVCYAAVKSQAEGLTEALTVYSEYVGERPRRVFVERVVEL
jgi:hypothetical protein